MTRSPSPPTRRAPTAPPRYDVPVYISPIAIIFNLKGVSDAGKHINLDADTAAKIFDGKIVKWNDPAIANQNKDLTLPDTQITVVHRSDKSGTTQNFVSYFKDQAPDSWTHELSENWPDIPGQQSAKGTSGVVTAVKQADGTIGYADFSQVGDLGTAAIKVGENYNEISADAGSKVIEDSEIDTSAKGRQPRGREDQPRHQSQGRLPDRAGLLRHRLPRLQGRQHRQVRQELAHLRDQRRRPEDRLLRCRLRPAAEQHRREGHQVHRGHQDQVISVS